MTGTSLFEARASVLAESSATADVNSAEVSTTFFIEEDQEVGRAHDQYR